MILAPRRHLMPSVLIPPELPRSLLLLLLRSWNAGCNADMSAVETFVHLSRMVARHSG